MRRWLVPLLIAVLGVVALAGCNADGAPYAARVHGSTISNDTLTSTMRDIVNGKVSACLFQGEALRGTGSRTYSMGFASTVLTFMIERDLTSDEVAARKLPVTPLAVEAASQLLENSVAGSGSSCVGSSGNAVAELPTSFRSLLSGFEVSQSVLAASIAGISLTDSGVASFAAAHPEIADVACVSEIVVSSSKSATQIIAKARAGTSFAALARANSLDTDTSAKGGGLGCAAPVEFPSEYAPVIASLATGAISSAITLQSPYIGILTVTSRRAGTALDAALGAITAGGGGLSALLDKLAATGVRVDPSYGHWGRSGGAYTVVPPSGPANTDISNLAAITPVAPSSGS